MLPEKIFLRDRNPTLVLAWREVFAEIEPVDASDADFFDHPADAMVSPTNSFGIMEGGLDLAIRDRIGGDIQEKVQEVILRDYHGEIPVGNAEVVPTENDTWPHLVVAPTMRVPESVSQTLNAYLAFRSCLLAVKRFNENHGKPQIGSLLVPGLATGVGRMDPYRCAVQMRIAYNYLSRPTRIPSYDEIHTIHRKLLSAS